MGELAEVCELCEGEFMSHSRGTLALVQGHALQLCEECSYKLWESKVQHE